MFAALDIMTIKMLQEIIVNLQQEYNMYLYMWSSSKGSLACVDKAMILSNCKIIADTPANLINDINARKAYFGDVFKFN